MATRLVGPARPYTTISSAIQACNDNPGSRAAMDIVVVDPGTYVEFLDFRSPSGGWSIPCIVRAADPNNRPVISSTGGAHAVIDGGAYRGTAAGEITLENLEFSGWSTASNGVVYISAQGLVVRGCKFIGNTGRICIRWCAATGTRYGIVEKCEFYTSGSTGIGIKGVVLAYGSGTIVRNNKAVLPSNVQFLYEHTAGPGVFEHNSLLVNLNTAGLAAVLMVGSFRANLIKNLGSAASYGVYNWGGTNTENFINGTFSTRYTGTDGGSNLDTDPLFANEGTGDLTLQAGSAAIRAVARSANTLEDILEVTRSDPTDLGAYEMSLGTTVTGITVVDDNTIKLNLASLMSSDSTWTDAGNYAVTPSGGASSVTVLSATVTDSGMSITLSTSEHTDNGSYDVAWAGLTSVADGNDAYTGSGTAPTLSSVSATGENTLRVTFSEPMATTDLETLAKYSVAPVVAGGPAVSVTAATREAGSNPTYVDLTISDAVAGKAYTLSVASGLTDKALNPLGSTSGNFTSPATTIASVSRTSTTVTLNFDRPVLVTSTHTTAGNYTTTPSGGAAAVAVASAAVNDPTIASSVTLTTGEHTNGGSYLLEWDGLASIADGSQSYTGVGVAPTVGTIVVLSDTTLRVPFSEAMATTGLETLGRYTIAPVTAGGPAITVSAVVREAGTSPTYVDLTFSETIAGKAYRLSVATGLTDKALNPLGAATADFTARDTYLASIEIVSTNRIVATLARRALYDPDLVSPANWQIRRTDPQFGLTPSISEIVADAEDFPQQFTLTTSNHTAGQGYEITYVGP